MPALPPSSTARYRFHYTVGGREHTLQVRSTFSPAAIAGWFNAYLTAFGTIIALTTLDFTEWAPAGSDIFNPVTNVYDGTNYGAGVPPPEQIPWAYTFIGRTPGGRRVRFSQFGAKSLATDYRVLATELAEIDAVITLLNTGGTPVIGIDGLIPIWKSYANVQVNDHWVKAARP